MILFLDFDGVLHPDEAYLVRGRPVLRSDGELFMWAGHLANALADHQHVSIVLSTSWARDLGFNRARRYLPEELRGRVIGATWHSSMSKGEDFGSVRETWWDCVTRYEQIRRYVDRAGLDNWLAIDDKPEGWTEEDNHRLIHTRSDTGLSDPAAIDLLRHALKS